MKEQHEAYALAGVGAVLGGWNYYIRPELTAKRAWLGIAVAVGLYELACPDGQTLSEGIDTALEQRRALTIAAIGVTSLHLLNVLPTRVDPFTQALRLIKGHD